jgi:hypothetical protein
VALFTIVSQSDHPDALGQWVALPAFEARERHPIYGRLGHAYFAATFRGDVDVSFAVLDRHGAPLALVWCNIHEGVLSYFGMPIRIFVHCDLCDTVEVTEAALQEISRVAQARCVSSIVVREDIGGAVLSPLGKGCVNRGARVEVVQHGICDLSLNEAALRRKLRKSFQSLLNTGRRTMRLAYFNAANPDMALFDSYRAFHTHVAGRTTRSDESWRAMARLMTNGRGELALGYLNGEELVSGTMTFDGTETAYYASGVYDRTRFDKPLAHFPLFDAIVRSGSRGLRNFDLGLLPARGTVSDKEYNIGYFKRGFATSVEMHFVWRWAPNAGSLS